jgi:DNA-binding SARP family transcriptional activator
MVQASCQRLIALLAVSAAKARRYLSGTLWPDLAEDQASACLRSSVWRTQRVAPGLLRTSNSTIELVVGTHIDARAFVQVAQELLRDPSDDTLARCAQQAMWEDFLPGWYEDWVLTERERLRQLQLHVLEEIAVQLAVRGYYAAAVDAGLAAVHHEPLRESAHRTVARVHLMEGNRVEALKQYRRYHELLGKHLGVEPSDDFTRMVSMAPLRSQHAKASG